MLNICTIYAMKHTQTQINSGSKIRNTLGWSSAINTAYIHPYCLRTYASRTVLTNLGHIDGLGLPHVCFLYYYYFSRYICIVVACISGCQMSNTATCQELSLDLGPIHTFTIIISRYIVALTITSQKLKEPAPITILSLEWVLKNYHYRL